MDGVLIIDKPAGITSHDVVSRVRRILQTRRVGHTGTLDPFATGVMVILIGKATRLAQFLDKDEKEYDALIQFGFETDTGDITGVRSVPMHPDGMRSEEVAAIVAKTDWPKLMVQFKGEIEQVPPMYSAKKVEGRKLYEHARKGREIERAAIKVDIRELETLEGQLRTSHSALRIRVVCSAGTYIRTLAQDIGRAVGTGAHLAELRRTRAGRFDLSQAVTLDELERADESDSFILPVGVAVAHLRAMTMTDDRADATKKGLSTRLDESEFWAGDAVRMLDDAGTLLAVGVYDAAEMSVRPKVVLV